MPTNDNKTVHQGERAAAQASDNAPVWMIGQDAGAAQQLKDVLTDIDPSVSVVAVNDPETSMIGAEEDPPCLCCLIWATTRADSQRVLDLVRGLTIDVPVILAGVDNLLPALGEALAAGAWDRIALDDDADLVKAKLARALTAGRQRRQIIDAQRHAAHLQRQLDVASSDISDATAQCSDGVLHQAQPGFARLLGAQSTDAVNTTALEDWVAGDDKHAVSQAIAKAGQGSADASLVFLAPFSPERHSLRALMHPSEDGHIQIALHPAESKPRLQAEKTTGGISDGRMALHRTLANLSNEYADRVVGLIFVAVDGIEDLQADHGLAASDSLLQEAGLFLLDALRGSDRCFRFAAGQYVIVIERNTREQLNHSAAHIHESFSQELFGDGKQSLHLTATVAHTLLSVEADDNDRRFMRTVQAAHTAQQAGDNQLLEFAQAAAAKPANTGGDNEWSTRLRQALKNDRFSLAYQNITSLAGDNQVYFDVLLRYIDDSGALLRPADFLPAAESAGLMPDIDRWVVTHAIDVVEQQMARDVHVSLFVKLSRETIQDPRGFLDWARQSLGAMQAPRSSLVFSLRASDVNLHVAESKHLAAALQAQGFRTALTHFGHTPTASQLLEKLALSFIKLSPEFAREVAGETADDTQLRRVIDSARDRDIPLIAEQIEDASSMARLWQAGVNYVQGHFIQEPDTEAIAHTDLRQ